MRKLFPLLLLLAAQVARADLVYDVNKTFLIAQSYMGPLTTATVQGTITTDGRTGELLSTNFKNVSLTLSIDGVDYGLTEVGTWGAIWGGPSGGVESDKSIFWSSGGRLGWGALVPSDWGWAFSGAFGSATVPYTYWGFYDVGPACNSCATFDYISHPGFPAQPPYAVPNYDYDREIGILATVPEATSTILLLAMTVAILGLLRHLEYRRGRRFETFSGPKERC